MADPRIQFDPKTKEIVQVTPPELEKIIKPIEGTRFVFIPRELFDLDKLKIVPVQISATPRKPNTTR